MQGYKKLLLPAFLAVFLFPLKGQNSDSPYSRYGYGVLNNQAVGASKSMGGISYGVRGLNTNPGNPASYSAVDSLTFLFDLGVSYNNAHLSEGGNSKNHSNGGLDYVTMQFQLYKKLGMSIGLLPFSSVGYSFGSADSKGVSNQKTFSGEGGFSQVYGGLGYEVIKNLSVGANISYLFGNTTYYRNLYVTGVPTAYIQSWYHKLVMNMATFDFGAQYTLPLKDQSNLTVGLVYTPKIKRSGEITRTYSELTASGSLIKSDTAVYTGSAAYTDLPEKFGAGFTWNHKNNLTLGFDATYEKWDKARYSEHMEDDLGESNRFNNRWRFNAGGEYMIDPRDRSFVKRIKFRGGFNYSKSYINVMDNSGAVSDYKEYGATLGFGFPVRDKYTNRDSYINLGFEYINLKPSNSNLIKEQYFGVSLGIHFNELWFMKSKLR